MASTSVTDINKLESVQKFALRLCVKRWDLGYDDLHSMCDLPILATRRKYFNLSIMYKIINHQIYFLPHVFVPRITPSHSASDLLFNQPFSRTKLISVFFCTPYMLYVEFFADVCALCRFIFVI